MYLLDSLVVIVRDESVVPFQNGIEKHNTIIIDMVHIPQITHPWGHVRCVCGNAGGCGAIIGSGSTMTILVVSIAIIGSSAIGSAIGT